MVPQRFHPAKAWEGLRLARRRVRRAQAPVKISSSNHLPISSLLVRSNPLPETIYDVVIIGAGPGGYTAAIRAGQYGLKVGLIEKDDKLGGTCLHVGCIPTKALLFSAEVFDHLKHGKELGIEGVEGAKINWKAIQDRKNKIVLKHAKGLEFLMKKNKVNTIAGYGRLMGPAKDGIHSIEVYTEGGGGAGGETNIVKTKNIIIAT